MHAYRFGVTLKPASVLYRPSCVSTMKRLEWENDERGERKKRILQYGIKRFIHSHTHAQGKRTRERERER